MGPVQPRHRALWSMPWLKLLSSLSARLPRDQVPELTGRPRGLLYAIQPKWRHYVEATLHYL